MVTVGWMPCECPEARADSLAERGLIERAVDRADRRRRLLTLSPAGRRLTAGLASVGTQIEAGPPEPAGARG